MYTNRTAEDKPTTKPADVEADFKQYLEKTDLGQNVSVELREVHQSPDLYYLHGDHLGTATFVTNSQSQATQFFLNLPFGETMMEQMDGSYNNPFKFNAKELDDDTGLYYYGARYYNPRLSIWYGVDPLAVYNPVMETEFYGDGQHNEGVYNLRNLNPYTYCYQNPIRYIDPNGKQDEFSLVLQGSRGIRILGTGGAASGIAGGVFAAGIIVTYKAYELQQRFQAQRAHEFNSMSKEQQNATILKESFPANKKEGVIVRDFPAAIQQKITILSADNLKPEAGYSGSGKHGIKWKEGKAEAKKTGIPQGQWGSQEDLDYAGQKASSLKPREGAEVELPADTKSVVHMPDGSTKKATHAWLRNNGNGKTYHGYPKVK